MKKSISYWTLGGFDGAVPVVNAARLAREMGYDAIELCYGEGELVPEASPETLAAIRAALEEIGIGITSLCSGNYWTKSLSADDAAERVPAAGAGDAAALHGDEQADDEEVEQAEQAVGTRDDAEHDGGVADDAAELDALFEVGGLHEHREHRAKWTELS